MSGTVQSISINGVSFDVPEDTEVVFNLGGFVSKEMTTYGSLKSRGHIAPNPGVIDALILDVEDDVKLELLQGYAKLPSVDVVVTDANSNAYGGAGQIIAESGITRNLKTGNLNDEIKIIAINGKFAKL